MDKIDDTTKYEIELLLKEYANRYDEIKFHSTRYHTQSNIVYIYFTLLISASSFVFTNNTLIVQYLSTQKLQPLFILIVLVLALITAYYFYTLIQDALCMIFINGNRVAAIEKLINNRIKKDLLLWDSEIISKYHNSRWIQKGWIKPSFIMVFWGFLILIILTILLTSICYLIARDYFVAFTIFALLLLFYNIWQTLSLNTTGANFISKIVSKYSFKSEKPFDEIETEFKNQIDLLNNNLTDIQADNSKKISELEKDLANFKKAFDTEIKKNNEKDELIKKLQKNDNK